MTYRNPWLIAPILCLSLGMLSGCDKLVNTSKAAQDVTRAAFEDTKSSWRDFFMYHPPIPESLPQTRYCYQMQSDIVCYDSEQHMLTSKLLGYQDGENISWVQPGGGSLGASGGEAVALRPLPNRAVISRNTLASSAMTTNSYQNEPMIDTGPVFSSSGSALSSTSGQISSSPLAPPAKQKTN